MAEPNAALHEDEARLGAEAIDRHRAIISIAEELEAVDSYDQRVLATDDAELKAILVHNRDEEKEHAAMLLEWLRRRDAPLDGHLRAVLFGNATGPEPVPASEVSLGIGCLRGDVA